MNDTCLNCDDRDGIGCDEREKHNPGCSKVMH